MAWIRSRNHLSVDLLGWLATTSLKALLFFCIGGNSFASEQTIVWRLPDTDTVVWRGMLPAEGGAVQSGQQIGPYPIGNAGLAGLIAAIATHATLVQMQQTEEQKRAQKAADDALLPFQPALGEWKMTRLRESVVLAARQSNISLISDDQNVNNVGLFIETTPVFSMSLDHTVLILDTKIRVGRVGNKLAEKEAMVRVISTPLDAEDPRAYWARDESQMIKRTATEMVKHVLQLAASSTIWSTPQESTVKTFRYAFGTIQRIERAEELQSDCARLILRNLRQSIMSVPRKTDPENNCKQSYLF